eukprot:862924-Prymnesium_polylepis.1
MGLFCGTLLVSFARRHVRVPRPRSPFTHNHCTSTPTSTPACCQHSRPAANQHDDCTSTCGVPISTQAPEWSSFVGS